MTKIIKLSLLIALLAAAPWAVAMQLLDEAELSAVSGEGLGTTIDDLVIDSDDYRTYPNSAFKIKLRLTEDNYDVVNGVTIDNNEYIILSELRMHKSRNQIARNVGESDESYEARVRRTGGFIGTVQNPITQDQLFEVKDELGGTHTVLETSYPGKEIKPAERSFFHAMATGWTGKKWNSSQVTGVNIGGINDSNRDGNYRGLPERFFEAGNQNVGNFFTKADEFAVTLQEFENRLDLVSDKFDIHMRVDAITNQNVGGQTDDQFLSYLDIIGMRYYGKYDYTWAHSKYGMVTAGAQGLRADELRLTTDVSGAQASVISAKGLDIYLPSGSLIQPHITSVVMYDQVKRGKWKTGERVGEALPQLRMETAALPAAAKQAPQGHVIIQQLVFGDLNDKETVTGYEDIYLRDRSGTVVATINDVEHRAFIPKTVTYNEQVDKYNAQHGTNIPNIPNQNVIEIRGLEIQRQIMTTQDLGR